MNEMLPSGIRIMSVYDDFRDCSEIAFSDYVFKIEFKDNETALERINAVLSSDEILAQKKAKQGRRRVIKETDIKPLIDKYTVSVRGRDIILNARLAAGNDKNLNPSLLFDTLIRLIDMDFEWKSISRIALLDKEYNIFK